MKQLGMETKKTLPPPPPAHLSPSNPCLLSAKYSIIQPLNSDTGPSNGFRVDPKRLIAVDECYLQTIKNHTLQTFTHKGTYPNIANTRHRKNKGIQSRTDKQCPVKIHWLQSFDYSGIHCILQQFTFFCCNCSRKIAVVTPFGDQIKTLLCLLNVRGQRSH